MEYEMNELEKIDYDLEEEIRCLIKKYEKVGPVSMLLNVFISNCLDWATHNDDVELLIMKRVIKKSFIERNKQKH